MDKPDYDLLDIVVEHPYAVDWLSMPQEDFELALNRGHHGLSIDELAIRLYNLYHIGDIIFYDTHKKTGILEPLVLLTMAHIQEALNGHLALGYALSMQGGNTWEKITHPRWAQYIEVCGSFNNRSTVTAASKAVVQSYIDLFPYIQNEEAVVAHSVTWEIVRPWRATYWKTLPEAYSAQFLTTYKEFAPRPMWAIQQWEALLTWYNDPFSATATFSDEV